MRATLGSRNPHKARELERLLPGWTIVPLVADDWPEEVGATYLENARAKAWFAHGRTGGAARVARGADGLEDLFAAARGCRRGAGLADLDAADGLEPARDRLRAVQVAARPLSRN